MFGITHTNLIIVVVLLAEHEILSLRRETKMIDDFVIEL